MKKDKTLLIMAAGMGSRFGGLKQIEPLGPSGEFIIDYSIYDAIKAGFNKVIFIIKEENYKLFKETIGNRIENKIEVYYVFQDNKNVPKDYLKLLEGRNKPLGTAHAILCAKDYISSPFAVINADDFYGKESFELASKILDNLKDERPYEYAMIGYEIANTIIENGSVTRGVCKLDNSNNLVSITECTVVKESDNIIATPLKTNNSIIVSKDETVSMNLLLFTPSIFEFIENEFTNFLEQNKNDLSKCEFFIPDVMFKSIKENHSTVKVYKTKEKWYGITHKEDLGLVKESLNNLVKNNIYPNNLWNL